MHVTPKLDIHKNGHQLVSKITNPKYIEKHAFFPLLYVTMKERRYKRVSNESSLRSHSVIKNGVKKSNSKKRPLHYASNIDALIFAYYAKLLSDKYEKLLSKNIELSDCIVAYRKLKIEGTEKGKGTAHFAKEVFDKISEMCTPTCAVAKLDIKSYFNRIDHEELKKVWVNILGEEKRLPKDHYNVFKAATRFSYINRDDLRVRPTNNGKRAHFDEKRLAEIRNQHGVQSFFANTKEFRDSIKSGKIKLYRFPFRNDKNQPVGIPQGLPISAVLANMYLLNFDTAVYEYVVKKLGGFYRRYSDDIIVVCKPEDFDSVIDFLLQKIIESKVEISKEKTEKFKFETGSVNGVNRIVSKRIDGISEKSGIPLTYLGFEFYGYKTQIKSANLARFYRRMILTVKRKSKRAIKAAEKEPGKEPILFYRQLYKLYSNKRLNETNLYRKVSKLQLNDKDEFSLVSRKIQSKQQGNYFSYVRRTSEIFNSPNIKRQLRNHKKVFRAAVQKHFKDKI